MVLLSWFSGGYGSLIGTVNGAVQVMRDFRLFNLSELKSLSHLKSSLISPAIKLSAVIALYRYIYAKASLS